MSGTIFSLIPPIVAIALALITKEVYLSLLIGIMSGAFLFTGPNPLHAVETMIAIMGEKIGGNVNILLFLAFLGIVVALITKSGASKAYGVAALVLVGEKYRHRRCMADCRSS